MQNINVVTLVLCTIGALALPDESHAVPWKAGVSKVKITPTEALWMSGYGGRDHPAEGTLHDLWAKAIALEDPGGERAVLVSLDLVGIHRATSLAIRERLRKTHGLERRQIAIATSHTHTGPVAGRNLEAMYFLEDAQWEQIDDYAARLERTVVDLVGRALESLQPCELSWGTGTATFAVNRRENPEKQVPELRKAGQLKGPFDHDAPVLAVRAPTDRATDDLGELRAVVFGYACHATVLSFYKWSGDYPGFAQIELERAHPRATALFFAGCGADQNPLPRRKVELAAGYGARLARAVDRTLEGNLSALDEKDGLSTRYAEIDLAFHELPSREKLEEDTRSTNRYVARRARLLLENVKSNGKLQASYPYPVQVWRLGPELRFVLLGGEVVVDYSLRLKRELGPKTTWVAGYANDVMAYVPSLRVLREGGYEGGGAMVYYGLPSKWSEDVEERIVSKVHELAERSTEPEKRAKSR